MADCINLNIPEVNKSYKELSSIFNNQNIAYYLLSKNNGFGLEFDPQGNPSQLYKDLISKYAKREAIKNKALIYSPEYLNLDSWFGNSEPTINNLEQFKLDNSKSYLNSGEYTDKSIIFISSNKEGLDNTINELDSAIAKGVKVFTMPKLETLTETEQELRQHLLINKKFDYTEKEEVGFYTYPISEKEAQMITQKESIIKVNEVTIDLNRLGFEHELTNDQRRTIQEVADWIDGKELKQKKGLTYKGTISKLNNDDILVFDSTTDVLKQFGTRKNKLGYETTTKNKYTFGIDSNLTDEQIKTQIKGLYSLAREYPYMNFKVASTKEELADLYANSGTIPYNVAFEESFATKVFDQVPNMVDKHMAIVGYAGTGKTSVTSIIVDYLNQKRHHAVATALTSRAVRVQEMFFGEDIETDTIHKTIGLRGGMDIDVINTKNVQFDLKAEPRVAKGSILIGDEASMTGDGLYEILMDHSKSLGYKILFIGDDKQLKPVNNKRVSKALTGSDKYISQLTTIVRQDSNNSLISTINKYRRNQKNSINPLGDTRTTVLNKNKTEGIEWATASSFLNHVDTLFLSDEFTNDPYTARIITYRNETASNYNKYVRKLLGRTQEIEEGEVFTGYRNVSEYNKKIIENGVDYIVDSKLDTTRTLLHPLDNDIKVEVSGTEVSLRDAHFPDRTTSVFIMSKYNTQETKEKVARIAYEMLLEYHKYPKKSVTARKLYARYKAYLNSIQSFEDLTLPGVYDKKDKKLAVHVQKTIDYGYAITTHKSQGGTYKYVLVDLVDIESRYSYDVEEANQLAYVALSRASKGIIAKTKHQIVNVDSFDFSSKSKSEEIEIPSDNIKITVAEALIKDEITNKYC